MDKNKQSLEDFLDEKPMVFTSLTKVIILLVIIVGFLGAVAFVSFDWAFSALVHSREEVQVPDITKKHISAALDLLEQNKLAMRKAGSEFETDLPADSVIRQIPPAGTIVREGKVIRVWVSQGSESITVPAVIDMPLRNAELAIRRAYLTVGKKDTAYSLTVEKGFVISQSPAADAILEKGHEVNLVVSSGNPPSSLILMPDFRQKKLPDVNLWASQYNMEVTMKEDKNSPFPNGTVIAQTPQADTEVAPASQITITVSARQTDDSEKMHRLHYELPQGKENNRVKIVVVDSLGEREVLNEMKQPGSKIDLTIPYGGTATFRVFVDGILVREREMK